MMEGKLIHNYQNYGRNEEINSINKTIYWGEVISITDQYDGGIIKVRINGLDNKLLNKDLADSYPLLPKFFHIYPKIGELVRVLIENPKFPQRSRFWIGSIISQPHKISYDNINTALSTTNIGVAEPDSSLSTYKDVETIYPTKNDVAILGRLNNDVILRDNEVEIRAGKHINDNNLKINKENVGSLRIVFESANEKKYRSSTIIQSDKIALLSHNGYPKFKSYNLNTDDRIKIFDKSSPIARGDVLVIILKKILSAIKGHIHPYPTLSPDKNDVINELEKINFKMLLNDDIVTN